MQKLRPDMNIGENIQKLRLKKGYSQEQVSMLMQFYGCKLSRITYSKIERNEYNICVSELLALKEIFDADIKDFFDGLKLPDVELPNIVPYYLRKR